MILDQFVKKFVRKMTLDAKFYNVFMVGLAFMLIFTGFQTTCIIEPVVLASVNDPSFKGDGYTSLAIIYIVFAIANWIAPSSIAVSGTKVTMIIGSLSYLVFMGQFIKPMTWLLYLSSVLVGFGAPLLWTGQGTFLTDNSTPETMSRNSGLFWAMTQCSFLFGNLFVFFQFAGQDTISNETRILVFSILLAVSCLGVSCFFFLKSDPGETSYAPTSAITAFRKAASLVQTKNMLYLSVTFFYTGLYLGFFSIYSTAIGFTTALGESKRLVGLSGIFIGVGEVLGGTIFGILGKKTNRHGRDPVILLGMLAHIVCYFIAFLNLPDNSPHGPSEGITYISPNAYLAIFCSFLLGFGDACFNTQIYSLLGSVYSEDSSSGFAIFKFIQSVAAAVCFFWSTALSLYPQLGALGVLALLSAWTFWKVEWSNSHTSTQL